MTFLKLSLPQCGATIAAIVSLASAVECLAAKSSATDRGRELFTAHCSICHQVSGLGIPGVIPPLAGSDWLVDRQRDAIVAVLAGLQGPIEVNGTTYNGQMPAIPLSDDEVAEVLTYANTTWGNSGSRFSAQEVAEVRSMLDSRVASALKAASEYRALPAPPPGFDIAETVRLDHHATRLASDGRGKELFILAQDGTVRRLDLGTKAIERMIAPEEYPTENRIQFTTMGIARDARGRLWISSNAQREGEGYTQNEVTIWRTSAFNENGHPTQPVRWFQVRYPYGGGAYNHGVSDLRFGPDGLLYLSSGSRTDAGETSDYPKLGRVGEVDLTASIWRFDPEQAEPTLEIVARGIRNAYSIEWDGRGNLFAVSNGPNADAPEEMDPIVPPQGGRPARHHGFPYRFGNDRSNGRWYPNSPAAPGNVDFVSPVSNVGPAGLGFAGETIHTFTPHSSPAGMAWLGANWPEPFRHTMLVGRFGNFLATPAPSGFDVLALRLEQAPDGSWKAHTRTFLSQLGRPIDLHCAGGKIYVLEYSRSSQPEAGFRPGRILELTPKR